MIEGRPGGKGLGQLWVTPMDRITPRSVEWLWRGFLPRGELTLVEGPPKTGKTSVILAIMARVTRGFAMPGEEESGVPSDAGLIDFENSAETFVRPFLEANGADLRRVLLIERPAGPLSLEADIHQARRLAESHKLSMLVIDGLMSAFGVRRSAYSDTEVRAVLGPWAALAHDTGLSVVGIRHHRKSGGDATSAGVGSIAFSGLARSILTVGRSDDGACIIAPTTNLSASREAWAFSIASVPGSAVGRVVFEGRSDVTADELAAPKDLERGEERTALAEAIEFVERELAGGPMRSKDLERAGKSEGHSSMTLRRARAKLGVKPYKATDGWRVCLPTQGGQGGQAKGAIGSDGPLGPLDENGPETTDSAKGAKGAKVIEMAPLGRDGPLAEADLATDGWRVSLPEQGAQGSGDEHLESG